MPESPSSLPENLKMVRKVATAVLVALTVAMAFVEISGDTWLAFFFAPALLLIFARRLDMALVIEFAVLGLWIGRRLFLPPPPEELDEFLLVYLGVVVGILFGFQFANYVTVWWQRTVGSADDPAANSAVQLPFERVSASSVLLTCALFFVFLSYGLLFADVHRDTLLVFGLAPAAFCAVAGFGGMRLRTVIITELVLIGLWLTRYFLTDFEPYHLELVYFGYYVAIAVTLIVIKLSGLGVNVWKRSTGRADSKEPSP